MTDGEPLRRTLENGHSVRRDHVIVATHIPFLDRGAYFARTHPERSYAIAVEIAGPVPQGMYISSSGSHSLRAHPDGDGELLLVGGEGHKVGQADEAERVARLEEWARQRFDVREVRSRWSSQDNISIDGLPYVGQALAVLGPHPHRHRLSQVGLQQRRGGSADAGRPRRWTRSNAWADVFDSTRLGNARSLVTFAKENANVGGYFVGGRLKRGGLGRPRARRGPGGARRARARPP